MENYTKEIVSGNLSITSKTTIVKCDKCGIDFDNKRDSGISISNARLVDITGKSTLDICLSCFVKVLTK